MRMFRPVLGVSLISLLALVGSAQSATPPPSSGPKTLTFGDPAGDARGGQAETDIVKVTFTTTGETVVSKVKGKTIRTYTPERLVAQMTLSKPPSALPHINYGIDGETAECGPMSLYYHGSGLQGGGYFLYCGTPSATGTSSLDWDNPKVKGNTITWSISYEKLPRAMRAPKGEIGLIHAFTAPSDPATGLGPAFFTYAADLDDAEPDKDYRIG